MDSTLSHVLLLILLILNVDARSSDSRRGGSSSKGSDYRGSGSRGSSSRGSGSRSRDDDNDGCCFGPSARCDITNKVACDRLADSKGCQWKQGATDCSALWVTPAPVTPSPTTSTWTTAAPTSEPTAKPTAGPSAEPTSSPTSEPTSSPSLEPTPSPSSEPTASPSAAPIAVPSVSPSREPTASPSSEPTPSPSAAPIAVPTVSPSREPTASPSSEPTPSPSAAPIAVPTVSPSREPTASPSSEPTPSPTAAPIAVPTVSPSREPTASPSSEPTPSPSVETVDPTFNPTSEPTSNLICPDYTGWYSTIPECSTEELRGDHISCTGSNSCSSSLQNAPLIASDGDIDCDAEYGCMFGGNAMSAGGSIHCNGNSGCYTAGGLGSTMVAEENIYCGGYMACYGYVPDIEYNASAIHCTGYQSCYKAASMIAKEEINCQGEYACVEVSMTAPFIECSGYDSCLDTSLTVKDAQCYGKQACGGATLNALDSSTLLSVVVAGYQSGLSAVINGPALVTAQGTESLMNAQIFSNGVPEMVVVVSGVNATQNAQANCVDGSECTILCNYAACAGFNVYCSGATCIFGAGLSASDFTEIDCITNSGQHVVTDLGDTVLCPMVTVNAPTPPPVEPPAIKDIAPSINNEMSNPKMSEISNFDGALTDSVMIAADDTVDGLCHSEGECAGTTFLSSVSRAECFGSGSCANANFDDVSFIAYCGAKESCLDASFGAGLMTFCYGKDSCSSAQYGSSNSRIEFHCRASESCVGISKDSSWDTVSSKITNAYFDCSGYASCQYAEIYGIVRGCGGAESCHYVVADTVAYSIDCLGNDACFEANIYENTGDTNCFANSACKMAHMFDTRTVNCDGRLSCSEAFIFGPSTLYGRGQLSLNHADINSCFGEGCDDDLSTSDVRDITVIAMGQDAMNGATLTCYNGSSCNLQCYGDACLSMADYVCYDGAVCNCDGTGCPQIVTMSRKEVFDELMVFHGVGMSADGDSLILSILSLNEMNGSMLILIGAMSVVMVLMALFYAVRRSEKEEYESLE